MEFLSGVMVRWHLPQSYVKRGDELAADQVKALLVLLVLSLSLADVRNPGGSRRQRLPHFASLRQLLAGYLTHRLTAILPLSLVSHSAYVCTRAVNPGCQVATRRPLLQS